MKYFMQALEKRQLLSATLTDGVLTVTGTASNDIIDVSLNRAGDTITVNETARTSRFKKVTPTTTTFTAADVTSIVVNAGAGNDTVTLRGGTKANPFSVGATINGDDGNDRLTGAAGNDTINGGAGDDNLYGGAGTDSLSGGDGDDLLVGGAGIDTLNGNAGDDLLVSKGDSATDILDGGADSGTSSDDADLALIDDGETATNATETTRDEIELPVPGFGGGGGCGFGGEHREANSSGSSGSSTSTTSRLTHSISARL